MLLNFPTHLWLASLADTLYALQSSYYSKNNFSYLIKNCYGGKCVTATAHGNSDRRKAKKKVQTTWIPEEKVDFVRCWEKQLCGALAWWCLSSVHCAGCWRGICFNNLSIPFSVDPPLPPSSLPREQNVPALGWEGPIAGRVIYTEPGEAAACLATQDREGEGYVYAKTEGQR